jgi:NAD(P)-dependent dehydrogenase (short-subunit alcohol dehydrogenase family)
MQLKGKTAIVTGSGGGIGFGIAKMFAQEGANVVICDVKLDSAAQAAKAIEAEGATAIAFKADVSVKDEIDAVVLETVKRFGALDVMVNNAAIEMTPHLLKDMPKAQWDRIMAVNVTGVYLCCQAVIPQMMKQNKGRIINIASIAALRMTFFGSADYTTSKHAVMGITHHLAWELADSHITVNAICPGAVLTPAVASMTTSDYRDMMVKRVIPLGRFCTPEDIASAAVYLASDGAELVTGQALVVDGGVMMGYGEDLRPIMRRRMEDEQTKAARLG